MSGVEALATPDVTTAEPAPDFEKDMGAIWDRMTVNNGSDRGDDGRFVSPNNENGTIDPGAANQAVKDLVEQVEQESVLEGADKGGVADPASSTPAETSVPLPPNWRGKEDLWGKIPADLQGQLAEFQNEQHTKLTEQGRQLATAKPLTDAVNEFRHLFEGRVDPADGIRRLARAQEGLDNPQTRMQTAFNIIQGYPGLLEQMVEVIAGRAQMPISQPAQQPRNLDADIDAKVSEKLTIRTNEQAISDFAQANPMWSQLPEDQQYSYTLAARTLLPNAAPAAVLKKALAMAIEDTPALKQQVAAAAQKPPVVTKTVSPEAARRANSVNVTSNSTGKVAEASLDDQLSAVWEKHHR